MNLQLSVSVPAGTPIVVVSGEVNEFTADDLYAFLATVIDQRGPRLSVQLEGVTLMHTPAINALLRAQDLARSRGGNLTLVMSPAWPRQVRRSPSWTRSSRT